MKKLVYQIKSTALLILTLLMGVQAHAVIKSESFDKIVAEGVPVRALSEVLEFIENNIGIIYEQDVYVCQNRQEGSVRPCEEEKRIKTVKEVSLTGIPEHIAIIDFKKPSTERRLYLINLETGEVKKYYTAHGIGSGNDNYATVFSNKKDSRQTSLGLYLAGEVYYGGFGKTLRMYGLEKSNDQAYNRDIVLHGAWYVGEDFIKSINPRTKEPFGRLGVSWGCPATSKYIANLIIPMLQNGSLIYHYHEDLMEQARTGKTVKLAKPVIN